MSLRKSGQRFPFIAFLITHPTHGRTLFDLGMRKPPAVKSILDEYRVYGYCSEDIVDVLRKDGVDPAEITKIIYSHLHWDPVGDPTPFTNAEIVLGSDAKVLLEDAWPSNPDSPFMALPSNMHVDFIDFADLKKKDRQVAPWGPYERAVNSYGDGSLYLVDSPGHFPGHLAAAARVGPDSFVFLAGDTCHNRLCHSPGERLISERGHCVIALARKLARKTVKRLIELDTGYPNAGVIITHDSLRKEEMSFFPEPDLSDLGSWVENEIEQRKRTWISTNFRILLPSPLRTYAKVSCLVLPRGTPPAICQPMKSMFSACTV
ncbi:uncharacterized protein PHACADRAFT_257520 [Phanerochaete carnosa HHB-10118-sp]|uniref:Metallo-beta-lactamase domain-containing protein n=1 Tax=Phanerochaete carnosa (strain HHB-10118-sp) TaxID=650164 RepID=K5VR84_PHACS|nr:uncharacterized protein PHACADRAFT_257520 [Phanerochaete carnosa HHB-10118-sp]EKM53983.1 hypothetical protein PHACADRAFT_257520 [Phanerochaete carnosa HHB-10118-sp]